MLPSQLICGQVSWAGGRQRRKPAGTAGEARMHPTIGNEIMTARITERHQRADAARLAAAAQQARRALRQRGTRRWRPVLRLRPIFTRSTA